MDEKSPKELDKKSTSVNISDKQFKFLIEQFNQESDRAAVILVVSILDETLEAMLKAFLVPIPSSSDSLFDSVTGPLSNFSAKIDIAFRLGLISGKFARDLHIVRKIRNAFAHDIYNCTFENGSVMSRIRELEKSTHKEIIEAFEKLSEDNGVYSGVRGKFLGLTGNMVWLLTDLLKDNEELKEANLEWFYRGFERK